MKYSVIIRDPAGSGKSTIARKLAKKLHGYHIPFDKVMKGYRLDTIEGNRIKVSKFIQGNKIVIQNVRKGIVSYLPKN